MIEYENFEEAKNAISAMDGSELLTQTINVDWAFSNGPIGGFKRKNARSVSRVAFDSFYELMYIYYMFYGM